MDTGHGKSLASMYLNLNLNLGQQDMFRDLGKRYRNAMAPLFESVVKRMRGTAFPTIDTTRLFAGAFDAQPARTRYGTTDHEGNRTGA